MEMCFFYILKPYLIYDIRMISRTTEVREVTIETWVGYVQIDV